MLHCQGCVRGGPGIPISKGQYPNIPFSRDQYTKIPVLSLITLYETIIQIFSWPISQIPHGYPNIPVSEIQYPSIPEKISNIPISQIGLPPPYCHDGKADCYDTLKTNVGCRFPVVKLVNWLTKKLYKIAHLSCYDQYFLLMYGDNLRPTFWLTLTNFLFWVHFLFVDLCFSCLPAKVACIEINPKIRISMVIRRCTAWISIVIRRCTAWISMVIRRCTASMKMPECSRTSRVGHF